MTEGKPSVREELRKIKDIRKEQESVAAPALDKIEASDRAKSTIGKTEYRQPTKRSKPKKSKEMR